MAEHTPGPWWIQPGFLTIYTTTSPADGTGTTSAIAGICRASETPGSAVSDEEAEANARLIAAAPDGHEVAEWALKVCEALDNTDLSHLAMNSEGEYLQDAIHAYLAKVRGEK